MSFVEQDDVLSTFEGMTKHLFKLVKNVDIDYDFPESSAPVDRKNARMYHTLALPK